MEVNFIVPGQPQGKARARTVCSRKGTVHSYTPEATVQYENLIAVEWRGTRSESFGDKPVFMSIEAVFQVPKSFTKSKQQLVTTGKITPTVKPDLDNLSKCFMDSLNGEAYNDDKQVVKLLVKKRYAHDGEEPHVKICLSDIDSE